MHPTIAAVLVIALFALIVVAAFFVYRSKSKVSIKGPFGTSLDVGASNEPPPVTPGVTIKGATSTAGGLLADDDTGRGAHVEDVKVHDDILVSSTTPPETEPKKAPPPA